MRVKEREDSEDRAGGRETRVSVRLYSEPHSAAPRLTMSKMT